MPQAHHEINFEEYVVKKLKENGWLEGNSSHYDQQRSLYPEDVIAWVKETQNETWNKLNKAHGSGTENALLDRLEKALGSKTGGTMNVLRQGFSLAGAGNIFMSQSTPEDKRNELVEKRYKANRLRVVRQLKYCPTRQWAIDLVFFINGIPVATVELKTDFTQSIEEAINQYKTDRLPVDPETKRKEPLLTFKRGAVVHFAMSDSEIAMTTHLNGENTYFLPFNQGNDGHAGNPSRADGEYPVAYFWEQICKWDAWLRIFHRFVYVETKDKVDKNGLPYKSETLIFPRYHQFEAVNNMITDAKLNGPGMQYLCEHSAGSGKTSTIAWTAHDLIKLRYPDGKAYFNSVIIVTDRNVLDAQLQDAVKQLDHQFGVIEAIDREGSSESKSKRLAKALKNGTPIIVVTIQTFPFAMEMILADKSLKNFNFAVIIDEAHTSQTGSTAQGLRAALSLESKEKLEEMTLEEVLLEIQKSRVRPTNVSHFAFTATPKHTTMTLFGRCPDPHEPPSETNMPKSFHRYTQRQAIEEGFILDVLNGYVSYTEAFRLGDQGVTNKRVDKKMANRAFARWKSLHPTNVTQKIEFIIEHFLQNVATLLNGEAKAMVVTSGRPQAVKYKLAFDKYIKKHKLEGVKALVAFSGKVPGKDVGDEDKEEPLGIDVNAEYSEYNLNPDLAYSQDLRNAFDQPEYNVMIVANKFQTGFNQPKLVAMYLDKKLSGVEAVQTLSRLNRTYPGKDITYVIDFVNEPKTILDAFKMYDDGAELANVQDVNVVYDMQQLLDDAEIYDQKDLETFKQVRGKFLVGNELPESVHKKLFAATQRPTDIFNAKLKTFSDAIKQWEIAYDKAEKEGDDKAKSFADNKRSELTKEREELMRFKTNLGRFVRTYTYIAQLIELGDAELENFASFAKLLSKRLNGVTYDQVDLTGLVMQSFKILKANNEIEGEKATLKAIKANDTDASDREKSYLIEIIDRINEIFGDVSDDLGKRHITAHIVQIASQSDAVKEQIEKNTKEQALEGDLPDVVKAATVKAMISHGDLARVLLKDPQSMNSFFSLVYDIMKEGAASQLI